MTLLVVSLVLWGTPADRPKRLAAPIQKLEELHCVAVDNQEGWSAPSDLPEGGSFEYAVCGRLKLPGDIDGMIVRLHIGLPMGEETRLTLSVPGTPGKPGCSITLSDAYGNEAGSSNPSTRLHADLTLETSAVGNYPVQDIEGLNEVVTTRTTRSALRPAGCKLETISTVWSDLSGVFTDEKSHEVLLISGKRVFYRPTAEKKAQELKVARIDSISASVQFGKSPRTYELKLEGEALSCKNPDGTVQTFKRTF
jgi:hypothetical protein